MHIEQATVEDVDDIVDCWVDLAADQQQYGSRLEAAPNRKPATDTVARHIVTGGVLIARDELILGFVMFHTDEGTYKQQENTGEIVNLYVRPSVRNCGIGGELLTAAENELASEGIDTVSLEVLADNEAARRFYRDHGYEHHRIDLAKRIETNTHDGG
jgi:Acetyltransferases